MFENYEKIEVFIPHQIKSEANIFKHWGTKHRKKVNLQNTVIIYLKNKYKFFLPAIITFTRISSRELEEDNLIYAFKYVKDIVAKIVIEGVEFTSNRPIGSYDGDPRLKFKYAQKQNKNEPNKILHNGFIITIERKNEIS